MVIERLVKWLEDRKIFHRERKSNVVRALGMILYHFGLSYEKTGEILGVSHEAIREWYQKGKEFFEQTTKRKRRKRVAVDEKQIQINGETIYIWAAVDLDDEKIIAVWVSFGRSCFEAMMFLKKVKSVCKGKLPIVFIDGGNWYPWALQKLGFDRYNVVRFGPRSAIERFFGDLERRLRRFLNKYRGKHYSRESMENWIKAFAGFRNYQKDLRGC